MPRRPGTVSVASAPRTAADPTGADAAVAVVDAVESLRRET
ncbi:hypothetical protein AB0M86_41915 [Streptomyces sp. NPDC051639]|nr:hypothetical protein [Streptomyces sp. NBC_01455]